MNSKHPLSFLLALGISASAMAQSTTTVYQDDFDDTDITTNTNGTGGGLTYYDRQGGAMTESAAGLLPARNNHNDRGNAHSTNSFSLVGGFQLTVEFTVTTGTTTGGTAWRSQIGLSASENVVLSEQNNTSYAQSFLVGGNSNNYNGIGIIPSHTGSTVPLGVYHATNSGESVADRLIADDQVITVDEPMVMTLIVNADQTYSYSINEETASEGTLAAPFDFSKTYHFHFYEQDTEFITSLQSVTLEVFDTPDLSIPVIATADTLVEVGDSITLDITFDPTATTAILDVPGAADVDLLSADTDSDGMVQIIETASDSHLYEVLLTKTGVNNASTNVDVLVIDPASQAADNAFSSAVKADSPLFYYRFEDAPGSSFLYDSSGNKNHVDDSLSLNLGTTPIPGGMGTASFWDTNGYIFAPASSDLTQSFTFMTMLNLDSFGVENARRDILTMAQGTGTAGGTLLSYNLNGFASAIGGIGNVLADTTTFSGGDSCLIHFVYDSDPDDDINTTGGEVRLYINGILAGSQIGTSGANIGNWILASAQNLGNASPHGWMDESAIFEAELTEAQIAAHNAAFFTAADPLLGFSSAVAEINSGETLNLVWKVSDAATAVTINGLAVDGAAGGGVYAAAFSPTSDTTYTIEVTSPSGTVSSSFDVIVNPPIVAPGPPVVTSYSFSNTTPPSIVIEFSGTANTSYTLVTSPDLETGFDPVLNLLGTTTTDAFGIGSFSFTGNGAKHFYRIQEDE